jgi:hypothetical protein
MAQRDYHINCILKSEGHNGHAAITHIGNHRASWISTREAAIKWIEAGEVNFYTADIVTGKKTYLKVIKEPGKEPYLRTHGRRCGKRQFTRAGSMRDKLPFN